MKGAIAAVFALALIGCGEKKSGPDLKKMEPEEACAEIGKRMSACKPQIIDAVRKTGKLSEEDLDDFRESLDVNADRCEGIQRSAIDQIADCYSTDCGKFAECMMRLIGPSLESVEPPDMP